MSYKKLSNYRKSSFDQETVWDFSYPFTEQSRLLTTLQLNPFKNIVGSGENAGNQHFFLFP